MYYIEIIIPKAIYRHYVEIQGVSDIWFTTESNRTIFGSYEDAETFRDIIREYYKKRPKTKVVIKKLEKKYITQYLFKEK